VAQANEQPRAETAGLKHRIEKLEQENRRLSEASKAVKRDIGEVSGLKELLGNLEGRHEKLRETIVRHSDEMAETHRRNSELGSRMHQLEEENRWIRNSREG
jgi:cell division protein FtsB